MLCKDIKRTGRTNRLPVPNYSYRRRRLANADDLNRLTAEKTGRTVLAGPTEATAIGNLAVQMITGKECNDLKDARNCIFHSFEIKQYEP